MNRSRCCCPTCCITAKTPCLADMMTAYNEHGGNLIAVAPVPEDQTHQYGIVGVNDAKAKVSAITKMVEKPARGISAVQPAHHRPLYSAA